MYFFLDVMNFKMINNNFGCEKFEEGMTFSAFKNHLYSHSLDIHQIGLSLATYTYRLSD